MITLAARRSRLRRFVHDVVAYTPFVWLVAVLVVLWLGFSAALYLAERSDPGTNIASYGEALYWGIAAFSTAGIADTPTTGLAQLIGGTWIIVGSLLFFGGIVATITGFFMRPMQRPHRRIIDTIEYNLEQMDELTVEELDLLRETVDTLIDHVERLKERQRSS
jgi:voltage-gated potassium channel